MQVSIRSYAKVNLFLNVVDKRSDGFHDIESLFQSISLFDTMVVRTSTAFSLTLDEDSQCQPKDEEAFLKQNLIEKVYKHCSRHYGIPAIDVRLKKNIPIGAGLGGGSSNAAASLLAIDRLFGLGMKTPQLQDLAKQFGSDVPFFITGGLAKVFGRGEIVEPQKPIPNCFYVLVHPGVFVATEDAYNGMASLGRPKRLLDFLESFAAPKKSPNGGKSWLRACSERTHNAFQESIFGRHPSIRRAADDLNKHSPFVLMSGTGSCVFGVFDNKDKATTAAEHLQKAHRNMYLLRPVSTGVGFEGPQHRLLQ